MASWNGGLEAPARPKEPQDGARHQGPARSRCPSCGYRRLPDVPATSPASGTTRKGCARGGGSFSASSGLRLSLPARTALARAVLLEQPCPSPSPSHNDPRGRTGGGGLGDSSGGRRARVRLTSNASALSGRSPGAGTRWGGRDEPGCQQRVAHMCPRGDRCQVRGWGQSLRPVSDGSAGFPVQGVWEGSFPSSGQIPSFHWEIQPLLGAGSIIRV